MSTHSTSLVFKEMKMKTTKQYHCMPTRKAKTKFGDDIKGWRECGETSYGIHCWRAFENSEKQFGSFFKNKTLIIDPAIALRA